MGTKAVQELAHQSLRRRHQKLAGAYELRRILTMTYTRWGNNSVGQSSVLIKRRSRVQVPVALPYTRSSAG